MDRNQAYDLADYRGNNYELIPLTKPSGQDPSDGKRPLHKNWRERTYTEKEIDHFLEQGFNLGVRLTDTQLVIDVDPRHFEEGTNSLEDLGADLGIKFDDWAGVCVQTGGGGFHFYYSKPEGMPIVDSLTDYPGIEFKTYGRQVVAASSTHKSGKAYSVVPLFPGFREVEPVPEKLLNLIRRPPPREVEGCGVLTAEDVEFCLNQLDVGEFKEHDRWLELMMSCHHASAGEARYEFIAWSTSDPEYVHDAWKIGRRWDSLSTKKDGPAVTVGTLFRRVLDAGGELPQGHAENDFDPVETEEEKEETPAEKGDRLLNQMNAKNAAVIDGGKFRIYRRNLDPIYLENRWEAMPLTDFENFYANRKIQVRDKVVPVATWWTEHPKRRQYQGIVFDPEHEHSDLLNLWEGWSVEPVKGEWDLLEDLIRDTLCDGNEEMSQYALNWCAHLVQRPAAQAEVALVLQGRKGSGKGTFARALMSLCKRHSVHVSHREHLVGRFNRHLKDCLVLFVDEAFWSGDHKGEGVLKSLITEPAVFIEAKGVDGTMGRNHTHIIMATNAEWAVPAGMDGERRYAVTRVADDIPSKAFFRELNKQLEDGGLQGFFYDMQRRDISDWHPRDSIPRTTALVEQKLQSLEPVDDWWFGVLSSGVLPGAKGDWDEGPVIAFTQELQNSLSEKLRDMCIPRRSIEVKLGRCVKRWAPGSKKTRVLVHPEEFVEKDSQNRAAVYWLPPLADCRKVFEEELGGSVNWG